MKKIYQKRLDKLSQELNLRCNNQSDSNARPDSNSITDSSSCVQQIRSAEAFSEQKNKIVRNSPNHSGVSEPFVESAFMEDLKTSKNNLLGENNSLEDPDEIEGLDEILKLPQPFREMALVKSICTGHKKRIKKKLISQTIITSGLSDGTLVNDSCPKLPELAVWQELPVIAANINSRN